MNTTASQVNPQTSKASRITGYVLSGLVTLALLAISAMSISKPQFIVDETVKAGQSPDHLRPLGITLLISTILYLVPRTSVFGAILLTGYFGGAIATHVAKGEQFVPAAVFGVIVWLGLYLRDARVRALIPLRSA